MNGEHAKRDDPFVREAVAEAIEQHRRAGRDFEAGGVRSFVREQGEGDPVVLMQGIPVSSFLYRKVLPLLAERGLRGVAFDLPGLGLAEKPDAFDYTWSGLGRWTRWESTSAIWSCTTSAVRSGSSGPSATRSGSPP